MPRSESFAAAGQGSAWQLPVGSDLVGTYLDEIVALHRERAVGASVELSALVRRAAELASGPDGGAGAPRDFACALVSPTGRRLVSGADQPDGVLHLPAVIAEIKRRSPSKGDLAADLDPARVARCYAAGGASCLSVLTDGPHFGGSAEDLVAARAAVDLPVLRKDFTVSATDVYEARSMGADAVLLIVTILGATELSEYLGICRELGMAALVEVHDEPELERALSAGATLVGVNQRDLHTFAVDTDRARRVAAAIPAGVISVAESGIRNAHDVEVLGGAGFDAVLVGEALVTAADPGAALADLLGGSS